MDTKLHRKVEGASIGSSIQIFNDLYLFKIPKSRFRYGQSYGLIRNNKIILIDAVHEVTKKAVSSLLEQYEFSGLILTHSDLIHQAWGTMDDLKFWLKGLIYAHPSDFEGNDLNNVLDSNDFLDKNHLGVTHIPGHTSGSIIIHDKLKSRLFTGDSMVGKNYNKKGMGFTHPPMNSKNWSLFYNAWENYNESEIVGIYPLHGKFREPLLDWQIIKDRIMLRDNEMKI